MKDFKQIAKEMRLALEKAIMVGPVGTMDQRLDKLLNEFEASILSYADDEASRRAAQYYRDMEGFPEGEPIFDKDKAVDDEDKSE